MDKFYKRTNDIDQKIHSVKLPYLAWKVLFLIDDKQSVANLKDLLNEEKATLQEALNILVSQGLITEAEKAEEPEAEEKAEKEFEEVPKEEVSETPEAAEEPFTEIIEEEVIEEAIIKNEKVEPEETIEEEEVAEEEATEPDFFTEKESDLMIGKEEPEEAKEEQEQAPGEEAPKQEKSSEEESIFGLQEEMEESSVFEGVEVEEEKEEETEIELPQEEKAEEESFNLDIDFTKEAEKGKEPSLKEAVPPEQAIQGAGEGIILVIDDSIVIRKMVELALENEDYQIETAVTGKDGLKLLDQLQPDLVILDLMLPDINGIDLLKTIKASKGIPVVMLSGKDSPQMIEKARAEGADAFLPKPFRDEELVQTIKNLIKK